MNNFVFHEEYIVDIPADKLSEFLNYIVQYGLYNKVPSLKGFELVYWKTIQRRIDNDKNFYEITCLKRRISAINSRIEHNKSSDKDLENLALYEQKLNELNEKSRVISCDTKHTKNLVLNELNEKSRESRVKLTESPYDIDYDSDIDIDYDIDTDIDTEHQQMPTKCTPSAAQYSKAIFELLKNAGLPCSRNNEISFLQTDFKNALAYLHKTPEFEHIPSDEIIGAVKNYIQVLNDESCYVTTRMNFFSLVKSKFFYNLLPSNFDILSFKRFEFREDKEESTQEERVYKTCPNCGEQKLFLHKKSNQYVCEQCFKTFNREKIE